MILTMMIIMIMIMFRNGCKQEHKMNALSMILIIIMIIFRIKLKKENLWQS